MSHLPQTDFDAFKKKIIIAIVIVSLGCAAGIYEGYNAGRDAGNVAGKNKQLLVDFEKESKARRDQSCDITEKAQANAVDGIILTYHYLDTLTPHQAKFPINKLVITQLPKSYNDAKTSVAPEYCNADGIGRPEPDPKLPPLKSYLYLLEPQ